MKNPPLRQQWRAIWTLKTNATPEGPASGSPSQEIAIIAGNPASRQWWTGGATPNTPMRYVKYQDLQRHWRWRLVAANNRIIADSGEAYYNETDCDSAIQLVKSSATFPVVKG